MSQLLDPITSRDFSAGRVAKATVATSLVPSNSVANSINVDYSEIIGSGIVRKGKRDVATLISAVIDSQHQDVTDSTSTVEGANWFAQTFTAQTNQTTMVGATIRIYRVGTLGMSDIATLSIRATSGGLPTGPDLAAVSLDVSTLTTNTNGVDVAFNFTPFFTLTAGTVYALVFRVPTGDVSDYVAWKKNSAGGYAGGQAASSSNSGSSWSAMTGQDFFFTVYTRDSSTVVNLNPYGLYGFSVNGVAQAVAAYVNRMDFTVTIFYDNAGTWTVSKESLLSANGHPIRFAVLNGYVFLANGEVMYSSADDGLTWGTNSTITTDGVHPTLLIISQQRMLASGFSTYPSRVYFSSVVDPVSTPAFITWSTDPSTGNWIDVNPDDGGIITGFANTSSLTLVFKNNAMYRINTISTSVDMENIFNVGAVTQECITSCLGLVYFYSGNGIYQTDGTFPQLISRIGVQDFVDAIQPTQSGFASQVFAGTDGFNVYFSIGPITITFGPEDTRSYSNVVLKFSPRDQNWQVFAFPERQGEYTQYGLAPNTVQFWTAQYDGHIEQLNYTTSNSDNGRPIPFTFDTQELEFGNRAHNKNISDKLVVYTQNGNESSFLVKQNDGNFQSAIMPLEQRVNVGTNSVNFAGEFFTFRWQGESNGSRPIFEGYHLPKVTDLGIIHNNQN